MDRLTRTSLMTFLLALPLGCHSNMAPPKLASPPAPVVAAAPLRYENQSAGIAFMYPAGWKAVASGATQEKFDPPASGPAKVEMVLDVPKLPFHIPNMIPIDAVRDGYVDDFKKKVADAQSTNLPDPAVTNTKQHRVKLTGHQNGSWVVNEAVTLVHGDAVYILSVDCDDKSYPTAKAVLDSAVQSLQWIK